MTKPLRVTVLGLGRMGTILALRLIEAGHHVIVWNRTPARVTELEARGAAVAASPKAAAEGAHIVIAMLRDGDASRDVWLRPSDGAVHGLAAGALAIEMSTLQPAHVSQLGAQISARGSDFVEAPVVGSTPQARAGQVIHFLGGSDDAVGRARPILTTWSGAVHHLGPVGRAAVAKLAVNSLFAVQVVGVAQYLALLRDAGMLEQQAVELLAQLPIASPAVNGAAALMVARRDDPLFPIELVAKDLRYATALAPNFALLRAATLIFEEATAGGAGAENITAIRKLFTSPAGG
jgi:3-hydroxyisobutyrate dehydrogenase